MSTDGNTSENIGGKAAAPAKLVAVTAIALLIAYVVVVAIAWREADTATGDTWARRMMLLGGFEALAFAAAGWIFGREIGRTAVESAKQDKDKAEQQMAAAEKQKADVEKLAVQLAESIPVSDLTMGTETNRTRQLANLVLQNYGNP